MSERTDERESVDADLDALLDESEPESAGDVGFDDDELGVDVDALTSDPGPGPGTRATSSGPAGSDGRSRSGSEPRSRTRLRGRLRPGSRLGGLVRNPLSFPSPSVPSPRSFGVSLAVTVAFMLVSGSLVPLPASGLLGVFAGAFVLGVVSGTRRYLELVVSGAIAAGVSLVTGSLTLAALAGLAVPLAAFGAGSGAVAALLGHYFGRDLRDGLTQDV